MQHKTRSRRVLTQKQLGPEKGVGWSRQHLARKVQAGEFPPPFHAPGSAINLWFEEVIDAYLSACALGLDWREPVAAVLQGCAPDLCTMTDAVGASALRQSARTARSVFSERKEGEGAAGKATP